VQVCNDVMPPLG